MFVNKPERATQFSFEQSKKTPVKANHRENFVTITSGKRFSKIENLEHKLTSILELKQKIKISPAF